MIKRNWIFPYDTDDHDQIFALFFRKFLSQRMSKLNHEILIINCTYKVNIYRMSLVIITKQIAINIIFYVAFVFLAQKNEDSYEWILKQLKKFYQFIEIFFPSVIITDCEAESISIMQIKYWEIDYLFCVWHINNNVLIQCRKKFDIMKIWQKFYNWWKTVIYVSTLKQYKTIWNTMHNLYHVLHLRQMKYLYEIYFRAYK